MPDYGYVAKLIWLIADLLREAYRPPKYERVKLPMTVLHRFDCVPVRHRLRTFRPDKEPAC